MTGIATTKRVTAWSHCYMETSNIRKVFTWSFLRRLIRGENTAEYAAVVHATIGNMCHADNMAIVNALYRFMFSNYRSEYFYQNTLFNLFMEDDTATALIQIPIGRAKADFILIKDKAVVYEIKTELDSLARLDTQIENYYKAFNHVCVVTSECHYEPLCERLADTPVGIYVMTPNATLSATKRKEPVECNNYLDHLTLFKVLRKTEYEYVIKKHFGYLPEVRPVLWFRECFKMFSEIPIVEAQRCSMQVMKSRRNVDKDVLSYVPPALQSLVYFARLSKKEKRLLEKFLIEKKQSTF